VEDRAVNAETPAFLAWYSERLAAQGLTAMLLIYARARACCPLTS
jgi:hypothetical protein